jgi:hypothetical protein
MVIMPQRYFFLQLQIGVGIVIPGRTNNGTNAIIHTDDSGVGFEGPTTAEA